MFKVIRDLLKYDGRFRVACVFLGAVAVMMLLSFVSAEDPNKTFVTAMDLPPSLEHIFGTSSRGQDIFWWMTFAVRNSILIAAVAAIVSRIIAIFVGLTAGYRGGGIDKGLMAVSYTHLDVYKRQNYVWLSSKLGMIRDGIRNNLLSNVKSLNKILHIGRLENRYLVGNRL